MLHSMGSTWFRNQRVWTGNLSNKISWGIFVGVGRLRVNMGNIYVEQRKFPQAIKMYRMALDQIQDSHKGVR